MRVNRKRQTWLVAPDSFKGSLSAVAFCQQVRAVRDQLQLPVELIERPMSDGGEGFVEAFLHAGLAHKITLQAHDPLGRWVDVAYGWQPDSQTAYVEMAQASGLPRLQSAERDPMRATSYGTGQALAHAINQGAQTIVLGLGGSATNDGGLGALSALGFVFLDAAGQPIQTPGQLPALADWTFVPGLVPSLAHLTSIDWLLACDVENPLLGPQGATRIFGPQKGVTAITQPQLEAGLSQWAQVLQDKGEREVATVAGGGAAGGMAAGLIACLGARLSPGFQVLSQQLGLADVLRDSQVTAVLTGEGQLDAQSLSGKLPVSLAKMAQAYQVPTFALGGQIQHHPSLKAVFAEALSINPAHKPHDLDELMAQAPDHLFRALTLYWPQWLKQMAAESR